MRNYLDWSEWILQKNTQYKEDLKKSEHVTLEKGRKSSTIPKEYSEQGRMPNESAQRHFIRSLSGWGTTHKESRQNPVSGARGRGFEILSPNKTRVHYDPSGAGPEDFHDIAKEHGSKVVGQGVSKEHGSHYVDVEHPKE